MGADLSIRSVLDAANKRHRSAYEAALRKRERSVGAERDAAQAEVARICDLLFPEDGYFRDSYNGTNVLWAFGLSWWVDVKLNKSGFLAGSNLKRFRRMVAEAQLVVDEDYLKRQHCRAWGKDYTVEAWRRFFTKRRQELLAFLDHAIEQGEPIEASL